MQVLTLDKSNPVKQMRQKENTLLSNLTYMAKLCEIKPSLTGVTLFDNNNFN